MAPPVKAREFGPLKRDVSVIGQGTWYIDESHKHADAIAALRRGLDLGMTHIDTAEYYGWGAAEKMVGKAIEGRRDEVFLVSKVVPENASKKGTIEACERSLKSLQSGHLDCYLLHWRGKYPLEETFSAFEDLRQAGKILSWGVSNFDENDLEEALSIAGEGKIACNQVLYHLRRACDRACCPAMVRKHKVALVAYSPFGHDQFPDPTTPQGRALQSIADAQDATPRQVALRFLARESNVFVIPKASRPPHVEENAKASELELTEAELELIDTVFPRGRKPRSLPMI